MREGAEGGGEGEASLLLAFSCTYYCKESKALIGFTFCAGNLCASVVAVVRNTLRPHTRREREGDGSVGASAAEAERWRKRR